MAAAAGDGWPLLNAPFPQADTAGKTSDTGLQRDAIATNYAVPEAFPQIEQIGGFRPDPLSEHQDGRDVPTNPGSGMGIALGDERAHLYRSL